MPLPKPSQTDPAFVLDACPDRDALPREGTQRLQLVTRMIWRLGIFRNPPAGNLHRPRTRRVAISSPRGTVARFM